MLGNLERSIKVQPRHVVVVMLWPENADLAQARGFYPPPPGVSQTLGMEVSGVVTALGSGAKKE